MTQTIATREFLRNFKHWKTKLDKHSIDSLEIPISEHNVMRVTVVRKMTPWERSVQRVMNKPLKVTRPKEDLFDERR